LLVRGRTAERRWRLVGLLAAAVSGLYLLAVLGFGYVWMSTDWGAMACFDGDEPGCTASARSDTGLSAIQGSSWLLGSVAVVAALTALVLALRLRRVAHVAPVLLLSVTSVVVAQVLWSRL
jgi:hypothetical protein